MTPFAKWAAQNGYHDVYAIYTDYGPGIEAGNSFKKAFTEAGGNIVGEVKPPLISPDYSAYIQRVKDAKPQAIFIFAPAADHPQIFLKAYRDAGLGDMGVKILATGDLTDESVLNDLGDPALGMITTFDYSEVHDSAYNHEFVKAFYAAARAGTRPELHRGRGLGRDQRHLQDRRRTARQDRSRQDNGDHQGHELRKPARADRDRPEPRHRAERLFPQGREGRRQARERRDRRRRRMVDDHGQPTK